MPFAVGAHSPGDIRVKINLVLLGIVPEGGWGDEGLLIPARSDMTNTHTQQKSLDPFIVLGILLQPLSIGRGFIQTVVFWHEIV